jgi:hypothetical protein
VSQVRILRGRSKPQVSKAAPSFEAHHGVRRFGAALLLLAAGGRADADGVFVVVDPVASVVPLSL